jgi:hypothetical protein
MYVTTNLSPDFFSGGENFQLTYMLIPYLLCLQIRKCSFSQKKKRWGSSKEERSVNNFAFRGCIYYQEQEFAFASS